VLERKDCDARTTKRIRQVHLSHSIGIFCVDIIGPLASTIHLVHEAAYTLIATWPVICEETGTSFTVGSRCTGMCLLSREVSLALVKIKPRPPRLGVFAAPEAFNLHSHRGSLLNYNREVTYNLTQQHHLPPPIWRPVYPSSRSAHVHIAPNPSYPASDLQQALSRNKDSPAMTPTTNHLKSRPSPRARKVPMKNSFRISVRKLLK
jgi:hypothetical protein